MHFFDKFLNRTENIESVKYLHPNFYTTDDDIWYYNRMYGGGFPYEKFPTIKVIFKFDDPSLLNDCSFVCKISLNKSDGPKYFGVAFAQDERKDELVELVSLWSLPQGPCRKV